MNLKDLIRENLHRYIKEQNGDVLRFNENQKSTAYNLFKQVFDFYLKTNEPKTYPMIYHNTSFDNYESIKKNGLKNNLNYFMDYDNDLFNYGFGDNDEEEPGIACGVNYKDVIDRLYPDPEWLLDIIKNIGNPSKFNGRGIDDKIIYCLIFTNIFNLDLNKSLTIKDISNDKLKYMLDEHLFHWMYVKGQIPPNLITIKVHPDFTNE